MPKHKLEPDENLMEFASKSGVNVNDIWNHANNEDLRGRVRNPWLVAPGEEIWVPDECSTHSATLSGKLREFKRIPEPPVIKVYLGFMDEEVNARLAKLIENEDKESETKKRPVILIERGRLSKDEPILEWRLGNYKIGDKETPIRKILHVSRTGIRDATKNKDAPAGSVSPKPPEIPPPPKLPDSLPESDGFPEWKSDYDSWRDKRVGAIDKTPLTQIRLIGLTVEKKEEKKRGVTVSEDPPNPPRNYLDSGAYTSYAQKFAVKKWAQNFSIWKQDTEVARKKVVDWQEEIRRSEKQTTTGDKSGSIAPEDLLARMMAIYMEQSVGEDKLLKDRGVTFRRAFDLLDLIGHRKGGKSKSGVPQSEAEIGGGPWLSVVRFDIGPDKYEKAKDIRAPIVVIRTPEMGLQPSLMQPYIEFLFKCISGAASQLAAEKAKLEYKEIHPEAGEKELNQQTGGKWEWPLQVFQFGAQGSCSAQEEYSPGKIITVIASLFVGVDIDRNGNAWSVISLCAPGGIYDFIRIKNDSGGDRGKLVSAAEKIAMEKFHEQADDKNFVNLRLTADSIHQDPNNPYKNAEVEIKAGDTLKETIDKIYEIYKDVYPKDATPSGVVTLTVSYFGGMDDKKAADKLGIYSVGMEDYHVLRILRKAFCQGISPSTDYPVVMGWRIDRVQCDPKEIESKVEKAFVEYIKETNPDKTHALMTAEDYADVIIWGLKGLLTTAMPECARWNFIAHYWGQGEEWQDRILKHFWSYTYQGDESEFVVPNPFQIEIATDLLNDLSEMKPGIAGDIKAKDKDQKNVKEEIMRLAGAVKTAWRQEEQTGKYKQSDGSLRQEEPLEVREKSYIGPVGTKTRNAAILLMRYVGENCGFNTEQNRGGKPLLKTWLRPNKWGTYPDFVKAPTTQDLVEGKYSKPEFDGACVDRAFYKSCNMMALQTMAGNLWGIYEPLKPGP